MGAPGRLPTPQVLGLDRRGWAAASFLGASLLAISGLTGGTGAVVLGCLAGFSLGCMVSTELWHGARSRGPGAWPLDGRFRRAPASTFPAPAHATCRRPAHLSSRWLTPLRPPQPDAVVNEEMQRYVLTVTQREQAAALLSRPLRGNVHALLYGPPGTGKTEGVHALCHRLGAQLVALTRANVVAGVVGESEANLRSAFEAATRVSQEGRCPVVVFIDELDGFFGQNRLGESSGGGGMFHADASLLSALMQNIDEASNHREANVLVVAATNVADRIDPALKRRLVNRIHFGLPSLAARQAVWSAWLGETPAGLDRNLVRLLARRSDGFSFANIEETLQAAARDTLAADGRALTRDGLLKSLADTQRGQQLASSLEQAPFALAVPDTSRLVGLPAPLTAYARELAALADAAEPAACSSRRLGALAFGAPATGKTVGVHWLAKAIGTEVFGLAAPDFVSLLEVTVQERLQKLGARAKAHARGSGRPAIVLIEELDCLLPAPSRPGRTSPLLGLMLAFLDAMQQDADAPVVVVATAQDPNGLDRAALRRLPVELPFVLPSADARAAFFVARLGGWPQHEVTLAAESLARASGQRSFEELDGCMMAAAARAREDGGAVLSDRHILAALQKGSTADRNLRSNGLQRPRSR